MKKILAAVLALAFAFAGAAFAAEAPKGDAKAAAPAAKVCKDKAGKEVACPKDDMKKDVKKK